MEDNIKSQLGEFLLANLKESKDFLIDQAPDVIQQVLGWQTCLNVIGLIISLILATIAIISWYKHSLKDTEVLYPVSLVTGVLSILVMLINSINLVWVTLYPKAYLLEQFLK